MKELARAVGIVVVAALFAYALIAIGVGLSWPLWIHLINRAG